MPHCKWNFAKQVTPKVAVSSCRTLWLWSPHGLCRWINATSWRVLAGAKLSRLLVFWVHTAKAPHSSIIRGKKLIRTSLKFFWSVCVLSRNTCEIHERSCKLLVPRIFLLLCQCVQKKNGTRKNLQWIWK